MGQVHNEKKKNLNSFSQRHSIYQLVTKTRILRLQPTLSSEPTGAVF